MLFAAELSVDTGARVISATYGFEMTKMSLAITCSRCQQLLHIESRHANQLVRCPACQSETLATPQEGEPFSEPEDTEPMATEIEHPESQDRIAEASEATWFMAVPEGRTYGPVARDELDRWVAAGRVSADCQLRCEGTGWSPADRLYPALQLPVANTAGGFSGRQNAATAHSSASSHGNEVAMKPHRGFVVLSLGILGALLFFFPLFSVTAWVMGNADLREMRQGKMDPSGVGLTRVGQLLGIIHVLAFIVLVVVFIFGWLVSAVV